MFSRFMSLFNGGMRAYKVQNCSRAKRVGVTAKSFKELVSKGREKLEIADEKVSVVIEDDGTLVDSEAFFKKLPSQTVFIFLQPGEKWRGAGDLDLRCPEQAAHLDAPHGAGRPDPGADDRRTRPREDQRDGPVPGHAGGGRGGRGQVRGRGPVSYTHLTLPTNREV
eukprot:TRINITY_DN36607_c0_g1_i7.p1 TRINITY_DN36607_c0_g1~~TRINITY_DN36607_c0_g1_i7.p1  ORF type:complete len:167 (-),score=25.84 TRINITY_DN36607_c0_g1_i7:3-503(-)